jgi:hypothetical protein
LECSVFFNEDGDDLIGSEPLVIRITLLTKLRSLVVWLILLPFLLLRENRSWKALWIFLPYYGWLGMAAGLSVVLHGMGDLLIPLLATLGILFLVGQRCQRWSGGRVLLAAILIAVATLLGAYAIGQFTNGLFSAVGSAVLFLLVLVATLLARLCCRRRYGALRFALFLLAFVLLLTLLAAAGFASLMYLQFSEAGIAGLAMMLAGVVISSLLAGFVLYLLLLSFLAVAFSTEFYGLRLRGLLKVAPAVPPVAPPPPPTV